MEALVIRITLTNYAHYELYSVKGKGSEYGEIEECYNTWQR